jgi:hypothetical protein
MHDLSKSNDLRVLDYNGHPLKNVKQTILCLVDS